MHNRVAYGKRAWYDNLREGERAIWERFLSKFPDAYDEVSYNHHVGSGAAIPEGTPENIARGFKALTQYKIDVIGYKGKRTDIIEIKPYAGANAIGQLISYRHLYLAEFAPATTPRLILLTDQHRADTKLLASSEGIDLIVV